MNNKKTKHNSTFSKRSSPQTERSSVKNERLTLKRGWTPELRKKFTAHRFIEFRKRRGRLVKEFRLARRLSQGDLGAPSQIRKLESGEVAQISMMELCARLALCPREIMKLLRNMIDNLPIVCTECRSECKFKGHCDASMATEIFDVTIEHGSEDDPTKDEWSEDSL